MAKEPVAGRVKTRLAKGIGTGRATGFFRNALAAKIRRLGKDPRWQTVLAVSPDRSLYSRCWPEGLALITQGSGNLGERMQYLFDQLPNTNAVIVGADIPDIKRQHIAEAFALLRVHDAVIGPADDGGYWLVGRRAGIRQRMFDRVRWSSPLALSDTLRNLESLKTGFLESLNDIDDAEDYKRWMRANPG